MRGLPLLLALAAVAATVFVFVPGAGAIHDVGLFQLDRNALELVQSTPAATDDWDTLYSGVGCLPGHNCDAFSGVIPDETGSNPFGTVGTQFQGGGSKDNNDLTDWLWNPGEPLDKDDITNAYAAAYTYTGPDECSGPECVKQGDLIVYFGLDRFANNGSAQVGFWFLQDQAVGLTQTASKGGYEFSGAHQEHDVLVQSNFSRGGVISSITVYEWLNGGLSKVYEGADCVGDTPGDLACATVNQGDATSPWPYTPKSGTSGTFPAGSFFEGGIDLTQLIPNVGCFSKFIGETRSSTPFDSRLKDFALGNFSLCDARIGITPSATNEVGTNHTFTVTVEKKDSSTGYQYGPAGAVDVTGALTDSNGATSSFVGGNTCTTAATGLDAGTCTLTITSPTAGKTSVSASAEVAFAGDGTQSVTTDGTAGNSEPAVKTWVDGSIAIAPDATNEVGQDHTFTVTVMKDAGDGAGFVAAPGVKPTVTLNDSNGATHTGVTDNCASTGTDASGQCTVVFTSNSAGKVTGHALATFSVGGVSLTRATDGVAPNSGNAVKTFVDAWITIGPDDTNSIGEPHTFTVTVYENAGNGSWSAATVGNVDVTLTNGAGASYVLDAAASTCDDNQPSGDNLDANGQCTVVFTSNTAGWVSGHATVTLDVGTVTLTRTTDGVDPNSADAVKTFVDGSLRWEKRDSQTNALLADATFEVCRTHTLDSSGPTYVDTPDVCITVTDNSAPDADSADGKFLLEHLVLGRYTVQETAPPPGYTIDNPDPVTAPDMTIANPNVSIASAFLDTPPLEGCTPGFWQGGAGAPLWNTFPDPDFPIANANPFDHDTVFNTYFMSIASLDDLTMLQLVGTGGGSDLAQKTARMLVAAALNSASGINFGYTLGQLETQWETFVAGGGTDDSLFTALAAANNRTCPLP